MDRTSAHLSSTHAAPEGATPVAATPPADQQPGRLWGLASAVGGALTTVAAAPLRAGGWALRQVAEGAGAVEAAERISAAAGRDGIVAATAPALQALGITPSMPLEPARPRAESISRPPQPLPSTSLGASPHSTPLVEAVPPSAAAPAATSSASPNFFHQLLGLISRKDGPSDFLAQLLLWVIGSGIVEIDKGSKIKTSNPEQQERLKIALQECVHVITAYIGSAHKGPIRDLVGQINEKLDGFHFLLFDFIKMPTLGPSPHEASKAVSVTTHLTAIQKAREDQKSLPPTYESLATTTEQETLKLSSHLAIYSTYQAVSYFMGGSSTEEAMLTQIHTELRSTTQFPPSSAQYKNLFEQKKDEYTRLHGPPFRSFHQILTQIDGANIDHRNAEELTKAFKSELNRYFDRNSQLNPFKRLFIRYFVIPICSGILPSILSRFLANVLTHLKKQIVIRQRDPQKAFDPTIFQRGAKGTDKILEAYEAFSKREPIKGKNGIPLKDESGNPLCPSTASEYIPLYLQNSFDHSKFTRTFIHQFISTFTFSQSIQNVIQNVLSWCSQRERIGTKIVLSIIACPILLTLWLVQWGVFFPFEQLSNFVLRRLIINILSKGEILQVVLQKKPDFIQRRMFALGVERLLANWFTILEHKLRTNESSSKSENPRSEYGDVAAVSGAFISKLLRIAKLIPEQTAEAVKDIQTENSNSVQAIRDILKGISKQVIDSRLIDGSVDLVMNLLGDAYSDLTSELYLSEILKAINEILTKPDQEVHQFAERIETITSDVIATVNKYRDIIVPSIVDPTVDRVEQELGLKQKTASENYIRDLKKAFCESSSSTRIVAKLDQIYHATGSPDAGKIPTPPEYRIAEWTAALQFIDTASSAESPNFEIIFEALDADLGKFTPSWLNEHVTLEGSGIADTTTEKADLQSLALTYRKFNEQFNALKYAVLIHRMTPEIREAVNTSIEALASLTTICTHPEESGVSLYDHLSAQILRIKTNLEALKSAPQHKHATSILMIQNELERNLPLFTQIPDIFVQLANAQEKERTTHLEITAQQGILASATPSSEIARKAQVELHSLQEKLQRRQQEITGIQQSLVTTIQAINALSVSFSEANITSVPLPDIQEQARICISILTDSKEGVEVKVKQLRHMDYIGVTPVGTSPLISWIKWLFVKTLKDEIDGVRSVLKEPAIVATLAEQILLRPLMAPPSNS